MAQGTHWAVAVTQAFLRRLDSHGLPIPFQTYSGKDISGLATELFFLFFVCAGGSGPDRTEACPQPGRTVWEGLVPTVGWEAGMGGVRKASANRLKWAFSGDGGTYLEAIPANNCEEKKLGK